MSRRFDYVKYDEKATAEQEMFKKKVMELEEMIEKTLTEARAKSLALTNLEVVYMWIGKALRDDCIKRNPAIADTMERTDE